MALITVGGSVNDALDNAVLDVRSTFINLSELVSSIFDSISQLIRVGVHVVVSIYHP